VPLSDLFRSHEGDTRKKRTIAWSMPHQAAFERLRNVTMKWHHYIENGLPITVITDHDLLKYMNTVQELSKRLARWIDEFQQYNLIIKYRPGNQAIVHDAIS
jgi:hypothetical protein